MATPNRVNYYTYKKIPGQKISQSGMDALVRMCNERFEDLSTRLYGNLQYKDLSASTKEEISESATDVTSEDVKINATDGLRIDTVLSSGETTAAVYFQAKGTQIGLYRTSDDKQLWGGKLLADGSVVTVSSALVNPDTDDIYFSVRAESNASGDKVFLNATYNGADIGGIGVFQGSGESDDPILFVGGGGADIFIRSHVNEYEPYTPYSYIFLSDSVANGTIPGSVITLVAETLNPLTYEMVYPSMTIGSGIHSDGAASFNCHAIPEEDGVYNLGSTGIPMRWRRLYCTMSVDVSSDERLKQDIEPIKNAVDLILNVPVYQYRLKADPSKLRYGSTSQGVKAVLDRLGIVDADLYGDENPDSLSLRYEQFIAPLIATVQQQEKRIKALEDRLGGMA